MLDLTQVNQWSETQAREALLRCCGSARWAERMTALRPFASETDLFEAADSVWQNLDPADWLEAFRAHPKIGDLTANRGRSGPTGNWAAAEQAGVASAPEAILSALADGNAQYEAKFGFIFIVCATGKTADEMLGLIRQRLANDLDQELSVAAAEQAKITRIRLRKLMAASPITTHVLDTSRGQPAEGIAVVLERLGPRDGWVELARDTTNAAGRSLHLLPAEAALETGVYRLRFATELYFRTMGMSGFYPEIPVIFQVSHPHEHYHIPLLLSPFGYTTYRGSH